MWVSVACVNEYFFSHPHPPPTLPLVFGSLWLMASESFSKKRRRRRVTPPEFHAHPRQTTHPPSSPSPTLDTGLAIPNIPVILDSSTPDDSMPDDDVHHWFTPSTTGAPPAIAIATTPLTHAASLGIQASSRCTLCVPTPEMGQDSLSRIHPHEGR